MSLLDWFVKKIGSGYSEPTLKQQNLTNHTVKTLVNWRESQIQLLFLKHFMRYKNINSIASHWDKLLGESRNETIRRYIKDGMLVPISHDSEPTWMTELYKDKPETDFVCAPDVQLVILQYVKDKETEFNDAVARSLAALRIKNFEDASRIIGKYESKQLDVRPPNPLAFSRPPRDTVTDVDTLKMIFTLRPKILKQLQEKDWEPLHIVAALSHLLHGRALQSWFPDDFVGITKFDTMTTLRMMNSHILHIQQIKKASYLGVTHGKILCCGGGTCKACLKLDGKVARIEELPELPYEKCTCKKYGCRCLMVSVIDF